MSTDAIESADKHMQQEDPSKRDEKLELSVEPAEPINVLDVGEEVAVKRDLEITDDEIQGLEDKLNGMTIQHAYAICTELWTLHKNDQNFPQEALDRIEDFLRNHEAITENPIKNAELIREVKIECILATEYSPYLEVRANTDSTDDTTLPCLTFRVWVIGSIFAAAGSFIDTLFTFRQPAVYVGTNVGQLLAYPIGIFMAKVLPTAKWRMFGREMTLNPGPFNKKEHMLITLMCNVSLGSPYTVDIVPVQYLPIFFNQAFAHSIGYQIINTMGTTFVGYGLAGLTRRFLVWPSYAIWPGTLNNLALIKAFHAQTNEPVRGPFGIWKVSREKFFLWSFLIMALYYFIPGYIFTALSTFSWITWIAPNNAKLDWVCGMESGLGFNPWPSFDWNIAAAGGYVPLTIPLFTVTNVTISVFLGCLTTLGIYLQNHWNTGYLPINAPGTFDNMGNAYNVTQILTPQGVLDANLYQQYSEPWMSAGTISAYIWYFIMYAATVVYIPIFHGHEIKIAFKGFWKAVKRSVRKNQPEDDDDSLLSEDVHARLMRAYPDVPEYVYMGVLIVSAVLGMIGVGVYPTNTSPVVMVYGLILGLITILPVGIIQSVTGVPVPTNVISEFIGGSLVAGNADALMYFKTYGYMSTYQALSFVNDLKLAHYIKLPPWTTFTAQMWATLIFSFVSSACFNLAMSFNNVCTPDADFHFTCPGQYQFFTAAVFWGTLSPKRLFGAGKRYNLMLLGFPMGVILVLAYWGLRRVFPRNRLLRQTHPIMLTQGPIIYAAPYNFSYVLPFFYVTFFSFKIVRSRYTEFWAKYNYVLAAAFPTGIAVTAIIIFFGLAVPKSGTISLDWWGNDVVYQGCEGGGCNLMEVPTDPGYFGVPPGQFT